MVCLGKAASGAFLMSFLAKLPGLGQKNSYPLSSNVPALLSGTPWVRTP